MMQMDAPVPPPSAAERLQTLNRIQTLRRRRGFLTGLLVGQLIIIALDVGGTWFLRAHPQVKLQAPIGVPSVVFLGMAAGAGVMILGLALISMALGLRRRFRKGGLKRLFLTSAALGVSIGVIIGTAWFMIPQPEWRPTLEFARSKSVETLEASRQTMRSLLGLRPSVR
jgi:hypothetical protein